MTVLNYLLISVALAAVTFIVSQKRRVLPYPPSLRAWPFFGNFFSLPTRLPWQTYANWSKILGSDVISVWAFGQLTVIINTKKAAKELIERRSAKYSDRPYPVMIELMGWDFGVGLMPYGEKWRVRRRLLHESFHMNAAMIMTYRPLQKAKIHKFLMADITMSISYGHEVGDPEEDRFVQAAEKAMTLLSGALFPGAMAVNVFPFLRHLPEWLPGMQFKEYARRSMEITSDVINAPWEYVKQGMANGTARPSMASTFITQIQEEPAGGEADRAAKDACASTYVAGADSTVSAVTSGVLALLLHPKIKRRAQKEIDSVIGRDRLPEYEDRPSLPYVEAVYREVLRWLIVAPLSLPRAAFEDDVYEGHFIPKGAQVLVNIWAMLHDPDEYPEPKLFNPERFLRPDGTLVDDDVKIVFGSGRRVCCGLHIADSTVWMLIVSVLSVFDIMPAKDKHGKEVPVQVACTDGLVSHPLPFQCIFEPRDKEARVLLAQLENAD